MRGYSSPVDAMTEARPSGHDSAEACHLGRSRFRNCRRSLPSADAELFGHPKGLTFLFTTEMWERFSYYGMRSLLVLYMTKYLLLPEHSGDVIGLLGVKRALEAIFGPLDVQPLSSQIWGLYTGLVYFTPIFGGLLADRVLGQRRTVVIGAVLMAIGHFMMAVEQLFLFALLALILGNGAFKPNISTQVGGLYPPGDHRRDRAYSIFYVGINVGAFLAPLVCGTLGEEVGLSLWLRRRRRRHVHRALHLSLRAAACCRRTSLQQGAGGACRERQPLTASNGAPSPRCSFCSCPTRCSGRPTSRWATPSSCGSTPISTAPSICSAGPCRFPTTWFLAFNPFMIFAFTPFVVALWARQAARGTEPSTITKMALGCFGVTAANLIMAVRRLHAGGGQASWLWLLGYIVVITVGELYLSPVGLSLVTKVAPARILSMMMGVWLATSFTGGFLAGWLGSFWSRMEKPEFFLMIAAIAALAGVVIFACRWPLRGASLRE